MQKQPDRLGRPLRARGLPSPRRASRGRSRRRSVTGRQPALVAAAFVVVVGALALLRARASSDGVAETPLSTAVVGSDSGAPTAEPTAAPTAAVVPTSAPAPPVVAPQSAPTQTSTPDSEPTRVQTSTPDPEPTRVQTRQPEAATAAATPTPMPTPISALEEAAAEPTPEPAEEPAEQAEVAPPPPPPARQQPRAAYRTYVVQPGDILKQIAARYGVSMSSILAINAIPNPDSLRIGQVLTIPPAGS